MGKGRKSVLGLRVSEKDLELIEQLRVLVARKTGRHVDDCPTNFAVMVAVESALLREAMGE